MLNSVVLATYQKKFCCVGYIKVLDESCYFAWHYLVFWIFYFRWRWDLLMVAPLTCPQNFLEYTAQLLMARSGLLGARRWLLEQFFISVLSKDLWFLDSLEKEKRIVVPLLFFHCVIGFFHKIKIMIIFSFNFPY